MAAPTRTSPTTPFAAEPGATYADSVSANTGRTQLIVQITLVGTVSQIQADFATLAGTSLTADSATISF